MGYLNWENKYSVGITKIDDQHKKLFQYINDLHDAMKSGKSKEIMGGLINELVRYTQAHFSLEEEYMKRYNYPGYSAHLTEHKKFTNKVLEFKESFSKPGGLLSIEVMNFLRDWLTNHVLGTDKKYTSFFEGKTL